MAVMTEYATPRIQVQPPDGELGLPEQSIVQDGKRGLARPLSSGKGFPNKLIRTLSSNIPDGRRDPPSAAGMDPLSQHIFERTNPEILVVGKARALPSSGEAGSTAEEPSTLSRTSTEPLPIDKDVGSVARDRKQRVSFLSRFKSSKKKEIEVPDDDSEFGGVRAEGMDAAVFSQPIGYIPRFAEPPKYIKVRSRGKKEREFGRLFLAQELRGRTGVEVAQAGGHKINPGQKSKQGNSIWALEFSKDGRYLAAAGHDHIVRVWAVIASHADRQEEEKAEDAMANDGTKTRLTAPIFKSRPMQEYEGHTSTVLALSWSKNNFLLSSSMDKAVRLWHVSRLECLCVFKHSDFVPSIQFHPRDDRFFLAGSLDSKLRLWSIPDKSVAYWTQLPELVTAVAFTPDGKTAIAGCLSGVCLFYDTEGLRQQTQMHVRSTHGKNAKGSKITGIQAINYPPSDPNGDVKLLITSNDSRVRIYNLRDKALEMKFKGNENSTSQIRASFSDDAKHIITGSEDRKAYIWSTKVNERDRDKQAMEFFEAHADIVTAAVMAPARTRQLLQASGDPLFEICNPPPVQLLSRTESRPSSIPPSVTGQDVDDAPHPHLNAKAKPEESPAYIARSMHPGGHIIVTADYLGRIKCFRADCAYKNRTRNQESWDTSSIKKALNRSSSLATRGSRTSVPESFSSPYSDRILSWRQSIERSGPESTPATPSRRRFLSRSPSPRKSFATSQRESNDTRRQSSYTSLTSYNSGSPFFRPPQSLPMMLSLSAAAASAHSLPGVSSSSPPTPAAVNGKVAGPPSPQPVPRLEAAMHGLQIDKPQDVEANGTGLTAGETVSSNGLGTPERTPSHVSLLTSEEEEAARMDDVDEEGDEGDAERCKGCRGESFRARGKGRRQEKRLECTNCGMVVGLA